MRIVWTKEAQEDIENIYRFWASKNEPYSTRLYNSLIDEAEVLRRFPEIGVLERFLAHRPEQFRSLLANKYYKLVYTVESYDVVIHAVWDCRRNPDALTAEIR